MLLTLLCASSRFWLPGTCACIKGVPHIFLGYNSVSKAYRFCNLAAWKLTISCDVIFDERSTSSSDASLLPLPSPSVASSTSAPLVAPRPSWALPKPLDSEGDISNSSADEDPLVTRRVFIRL